MTEQKAALLYRGIASSAKGVHLASSIESDE
jgi:hypothetical protein